MLKNEKGFTLIEMVMAGGIGVFIVLAGFQFLRMVNDANDRNIDSLDTLIEKELVDRVLLRDVLNLNPSFNFVTSKDDNGKSFFKLVEIACMADCERTVTIEVPKTAGERSAEFNMIVIDKRRSARVIYDIESAYRFSGESAIFVGLNKDGVLEKVDGSEEDVMKNTPWIEGNFISVYLQSYHNDLGPSGIFPSRYYTFFGKVQNDKLEMFDFTRSNGKNIAGVKRLTSKGGRTDVTTIQDFLDYAPFVAGLKQNVIIDPVSFVTYYIEAKKGIHGQIIPELVREELSGRSSKPIRRVISKKVRKIKFSREDITSPTISFKAI